MLAFFGQPVLGQVVAELVVADAERTSRTRLIALGFAERVGKGNRDSGTVCGENG